MALNFNNLNFDNLELSDFTWENFRKIPENQRKDFLLAELGLIYKQNDYIKRQEIYTDYSDELLYFLRMVDLDLKSYDNNYFYSFLINEEDGKFWNDSVDKLINEIKRLFQNDYEEKLIENKDGTILKTTYFSIPINDYGLRIEDVKDADAGANFCKEEDIIEIEDNNRYVVNPWVIPWNNVDGNTYRAVRGADKIQEVLQNSENLQFTRKSKDLLKQGSKMPRWIRLLMPQNIRKVEVEDLNRNFWVIGQTLSAIGGYLFGEGGLPNILNSILDEIVQLWENIIYLWGNLGLLNSETINNVHIEIAPIPVNQESNYLKYDNIQEVIYNNNFWTDNYSYLIEMYPNTEIFLIPEIRKNNYKRNYFSELYIPAIGHYKNGDWITLSNSNVDVKIENGQASIIYGAATPQIFDIIGIAKREDTYSFISKLKDAEEYTSFTQDIYSGLLRLSYDFKIENNQTILEVGVKDVSRFIYNYLTGTGTLEANNLNTEICKMEFNNGFWTFINNNLPSLIIPINNSFEINYGYYQGELISEQKKSTSFIYDAIGEDVSCCPILKGSITLDDNQVSDFPRIYDSSLVYDIESYQTYDAFLAALKADYKNGSKLITYNSVSKNSENWTAAALNCYLNEYLASGVIDNKIILYIANHPYNYSSWEEPSYNYKRDFFLTLNDNTSKLSRDSGQSVGNYKLGALLYIPLAGIGAKYYGDYEELIVSETTSLGSQMEFGIKYEEYIQGFPNLGGRAEINKTDSDYYYLMYGGNSSNTVYHFMAPNGSSEINPNDFRIVRIQAYFTENAFLYWHNQGENYNNESTGERSYLERFAYQFNSRNLKENTIRNDWRNWIVADYYLKDQNSFMIDMEANPNEWSSLVVSAGTVLKSDRSIYSDVFKDYPNTNGTYIGYKNYQILNQRKKVSTPQGDTADLQNWRYYGGTNDSWSSTDDDKEFFNFKITDRITVDVFGPDGAQLAQRVYWRKSKTLHSGDYNIENQWAYQDKANTQNYTVDSLRSGYKVVKTSNLLNWERYKSNGISDLGDDTNCVYNESWASDTPGAPIN